MTMPEPTPVVVLLVDDRDENLIALEALLRREDLVLLMARSGRQALELLLVHDVALALVDVQMPELDGFELAELMRGAEKTRRVPIIFVTAGAHEAKRVFRGYDAGAVDFLFKPIDPGILKHKCDTFVELHRKRQELDAHVQMLRELRTEQARLHAELAATLRLNETFVAAVGHDLRTPLTAMLAGAAMLARGPADARTQALARVVLTSGRRMSRMIDDLFDLTRARVGGGMPIERAPIDLRAVIEHVVDEALVSASDGRIETTLEGDLRGAWDASRLEQLFSNLLVNALRHGAPDAPVVLRAVGSGDHVTFTLTNGGAIASALLPNLFDPFRSDRTRRAGTVGLGLGLYIVQQIVVAHGGSIEVRSNEAEGTTFRVVLLRDAGATSVAAPGSGDPLAGLATSRFAPESIERSEVRREALRDST